MTTIAETERVRLRRRDDAMPTRRPDLDCAHPGFAPDHEPSAHVTYVADRPA